MENALIFCLNNCTRLSPCRSVDQFVVYFVVLKFYIFIRNIIICNRTGNKTISDKKGLAVMYVIRITPVLDAIIIRRLVACSLCINTESAIYGGS